MISQKCKVALGAIIGFTYNQVQRNILNLLLIKPYISAQIKGPELGQRKTFYLLFLCLLCEPLSRPAYLTVGSPGFYSCFPILSSLIYFVLIMLCITSFHYQFTKAAIFTTVTFKDFYIFCDLNKISCDPLLGWAQCLGSFRLLFP